MRLNKKITKDMCEQFLKELALSDYAFHLDDESETIINSKTGKRIFTDYQCKMLNYNLDLCFEHLGGDKVWDIYMKAIESRK